MLLIVVYILLVIVGETGAVFLGLYLDHALPAMSLPIALTLIFAVLGLAWPLSVYITERWLISKPQEKADCGRPD